MTMPRYIESPFVTSNNPVIPSPREHGCGSLQRSAMSFASRGLAAPVTMNSHSVGVTVVHRTLASWKSFRRSRTLLRDRPKTVRLHHGTGVHLGPDSPRRRDWPRTNIARGKSRLPLKTCAALRTCAARRSLIFVLQGGRPKYWERFSVTVTKVWSLIETIRLILLLW